MAGQWVPRDQDELTAGWRLWLELGSAVWPRPDWDGSPDEGGCLGHLPSPEGGGWASLTT